MTFKNGTPPHDTLSDIFAALDFEAFQKRFAAWPTRFVGAPGEVVAIDGKTTRRTFKKAKGEAAIHVVTAYAVERRLVLGQVKTEQKSNEITAVPSRTADQGARSAIMMAWVGRKAEATSSVPA